MRSQTIVDMMSDWRFRVEKNHNLKAQFFPAKLTPQWLVRYILVSLL